MTSTPIPVMPIIYCILGAGLLAASVWFSLIEDRTDTLFFEPIARSAETEPQPELYDYHLAPVANEAKETIIANSGFALSRDQYSRMIQSVAPQPEVRNYEPRYVGKLGRGESVKVMIIWQTGDAAKTHMIGEDTPWGRLVEVTGSQIVFDKSGEEKRWDIF